MTDNRYNLGQIWTPELLAVEMARKLTPYVNTESVILEPSCGPGALIAAVYSELLQFNKLIAFEIDPEILELGSQIFKRSNIELHLEDFLQSQLIEDNSIDLAILNPPYVRQEVIPESAKLGQARRLEKINQEHQFDRKSNYFTYFLLEVALKLKPGGVMVALVYNSLSHTQYGMKTLSVLDSLGHTLERKTIETPFQDVSVDAQILVWKKYTEDEVAPKDTRSALAGPTYGFAEIQELAHIKRGTSFPKRDFYTGDSPWLIENGKPLISKIDSTATVASTANSYCLSHAKPLPEREVERYFTDLGYEPRTTKLPKPVTGQILFNYYFREHPRHVWNSENFIASDNFYCLEPKPGVDPLALWLVLNSTVTIENLTKRSRPQGSGLMKLQLFEYSEVEVPDIRMLSDEDKAYLGQLAEVQIEKETSKSALREMIDVILDVKRGEEFFGEITYI